MTDVFPNADDLAITEADILTADEFARAIYALFRNRFDPAYADERKLLRHDAALRAQRELVKQEVTR